MPPLTAYGAIEANPRVERISLSVRALRCTGSESSVPTPRTSVTTACARKGRYLACHLVLEPHDHGHGQDHYRHAQRHGNHGDTLHHPGFVIRGVLRRPAGDEKGEVHGC